MKWFDPVKEKLIEIYSQYGSSEKKEDNLIDKPMIGISAQEFLKKGYRFGFIAGSDNHHGTSALASYPSRFSHLNYKAGIAAVFSQALTRQSIFNSLRNRFCYATTGEKILLEFFINDIPMGSEVLWENNEKRQIKILAAGTDLIKSIEIIRNNKKIFVYSGKNEIEQFMFYDDEPFDNIAFTSSINGSKFIYYYIRVIQRDNEIAWSSPIWFSNKA